MAFRGTEGPMDFQWDTHGPSDPNSPFVRRTAESTKLKRTHTDFSSPAKSSVPALRQPDNSTYFFSNVPPASPAQYRTPSFTTPRKPIDYDFSSGPESSPAVQADDEDTPNTKPLPPLPIEFNGTKPIPKSNTLFSRLTSSSGKGEIVKPTRRIEKRMHKRRQAQKFEREPNRQQQLDEETSDDNAPPDPPRPRVTSRQTKQQHEVGWMTGFFTLLHSYPDAPSTMTKWLQTFFNAAIGLGCIYMILSFYWTIQADVDRAGEDAKAEVLAEMAACTRNYMDNNCAPDKRLPALETICSNWEICMNRDPDQIKRARLSAHTFAEIFNSFVEPISLKTMQVHPSGSLALGEAIDKCVEYELLIETLFRDYPTTVIECQEPKSAKMIFTVTIVCLGLFVNNATFIMYRRSQEQSHMNGNQHQHSGSYMQPGPNPNYFPSTPSLTYDQQHQMGWHTGPRMLHDQQQQYQLEYPQSPSKEYGRTRSRSPEKKRLML